MVWVSEELDQRVRPTSPDHSAAARPLFGAARGRREADMNERAWLDLEKERAWLDLEKEIAARLADLDDVLMVELQSGAAGPGRRKAR